RARRNIILDIFNKYTDNRKNLEVFDLGYGSGYLVKTFQSEDQNAYGADSFAEAIEFGRKKGIQNLNPISEEKIDCPNGKFDAVLALDVLEHLKDESWAIKEMERILKPGGLAIITVPAYMFLWGVQDEVSHHFRRYMMKGLKKAVRENSSLSIVRKTYFNSLL